MISVLKRGPAIEPVTVAELRDHLRLDADDDKLLRSLISSARLLVEAQTGLRLIEQSWHVLLSAWPGEAVALPHRPVIAVDSIRLVGDTTTTLDPADYEVEADARPALIIAGAKGWPAVPRARHGIRIEARFGYGAASGDVPDPLRLAVLMLAAHWYEMDDWHGCNQATSIPGRVEMLIGGYREMRL